MKNKKRQVFIAIVIFSIFFIVFFSSHQNKVIVTFQGYSGSNEVSINKNTKLDSKYVPKREGYKFVGWYYNDKLFDFDTKISNDITLVARWEKVKYDEYYIKFMVDNVVISSSVVSEDEKISQPIDPSKNGYIFLGWYYNGKLYDFHKKVSKNMTLVAKFEKNEESNLNENNGYINPPKTPNDSDNGGNFISKPNDITPPNDFVLNVDVTTHSIKVIAKTTDNVTNEFNLKYLYSINGGEFQSNSLFDGLKPNTKYIISVKVVDEAGNVRVVKREAITKRIKDVKVDSITPSKPTRLNVMLNVVKSPEFKLIYSVDGGKTWTESLDGKIIVSENCKVLICNVDISGNRGEVLTYNISNIDREKPNVFEPNIHITTNSIIVDAETTDNLTSSDKLVYSYQLDWGEEQSKGIFKKISTGVHHLVIKVKDEAGNLLVIEKDVIVSGVESPIIKVSKTEITNEDIILTLENRVDDYQLECKKESDEIFRNCEMPLVISENQTLLFRYYDGVNYSTTVKVIIDNIDRSRPVVNFDDSNLEYQQEQSMHFVIKDNIKLESISYAISDDDKFDEELEWTSLDGPFNDLKDMTVTVDDKTGKYYVLVKAIDTAGNLVKAVSPVLLVDNELPTIDLEKTEVTTNSITIKVKATDKDSGILGYYYSNDGGKTYTPLQNTDSYTFKNLKNDTKYSIAVKVQDKASNRAFLKPISILTNDFKEVSIDVGEDDWTNKRLVTVNYPSTLGESYYYKIDDFGQWQPILEFPFKQLYTKNGKFSFMVSDGVNNRINNVDIKKIDYISPVINNISISDLDYNQVKLRVNATDIGGDDERSGILGYSYNCGNNVYSGMTTNSGYFCTELEKDTSYDMGVLVYDVAGNVIEKKIPVKTLPKYEGRVLPNTPEKLDGNNYFKSDKNLKNYGFYLSSESWNKNVYTLNLGLDTFIGLASKGTVQYSVQFRNDTKLPMTEGDIKANIISNNLGYIKVVSSMLDKKVVEPGESVRLTVSIDSNFLIPVGGQSVQAIATYVLQGAEREFIFNINFI